MRFANSKPLLILLLIISACSVLPNQDSETGISTPTPFQPLTDSASDSPYSSAAPTPLYLPTFTALPPTPTEVVVQPGSLPSNVNLPQISSSGEIDPLTGLPAPNPALLERHPIAIKIANYPRYIRPQSGLTLVDQAYEYYIEGGLTRFVGVFYSNDSEWVGPVRSGRFFDENIQRMYHAYLVFKFADPRVLGYFKTTDFADYLVTPTIGRCPPFHKMSKTRPNMEDYNNEYFNTIAWADCIARDNLDNTRPLLSAGTFSETPPELKLLGTQIFTYYSVDSYNYWLYRPETQQYVRYQERDDTRNGKEESYDVLMDNVTATAVHASNVVVLFAYHTFANAYDADDEVYHINLTDSGEAYVFRDGVGIIAKWYRINRDQPLLLTTPQGEPIALRPGITFYEVIGKNSYVDQSDGEWNFHHNTP
jgi:hypothetical protein